MYKHTNAGTPYFTSPEVALLSKPNDGVQTVRVKTFLEQLDEQFVPYVHEPRSNLTDPEMLIKFAGQLDYLSFGQGHTLNSDAQKYFARIRSEGHGSILEAANFGFLVWGVSRSCTHEIVRHRAGFAYSQVSQRYVTRVRFIERPEYQDNGMWHQDFEERIDDTKIEYESLLESLMEYLPKIDGQSRTERLKACRQAARSVLPNETETAILITANVRAWRHFLEMRANQHAEVEIRALAMELYYVLCAEAPLLFEDYTVVQLPDGTQALHTETRKV